MMTPEMDSSRPVTPASRTAQKTWWAAAAMALIVLVVVCVRIRLLQIPLERDEGEFAYEGQLMLDGVAPYQLVYHMKLPGTYAVYAAMMAVFGQSIAGIHFGFLLANVATVILVFLVGRRLIDGPEALAARIPACLEARPHGPAGKGLFDSPGAIIAASSYALLSANPTLAGLAAHATHLVALAAMGGLWLLLRARQSGSGATCFWSGLLFGMAFLCKQPGLFFGLFGGAVLLRDEMQRRPVAWRQSLRKLGLFCAGMAFPFAAACLVIWRAGTFERFWFWTFDYAKVQMALLPAETARYQLRTFLTQSGLMPWAWLLAGIGFIIVLRQKEQPDRRFILTALLGCSLLAFITRLYFTGHYFIVMLPVVSLLAGIGVRAAADKLESARGRALGVIPQSLFFLACAFYIYYNRAVWFELAPEAVSRTLYGINPFPESLVLARYIQEHSARGARIAVMGSEPEIYFYAQRHSATGYINMYDLVEPNPYSSQMQRELIREVEAAQPEYFLFVNVDTSWLAWPGADSTVLDWSRQYTHQFYEPIGMTYIYPTHTEYAWNKEGVKKDAGTAWRIYVFKRKL